MKVARPFLPMVILLLPVFFIAISCTKSDITTSAANAPTTGTPPPATSHIAPVAMAGTDQSFQLPVDSISLSGNYTVTNPFDRVRWQKISGPVCTIDDQNTLTTHVRNLQPGAYEFVLSVFDKANLQGRDTVAVTVFPAYINTGQRSVLFESLTWIFPWYNSLEIRNIYANIPMGVPIRVFIQRGSSLNWIEANPVSNYQAGNYEYFIETRPYGAGMYNLGSLYVFYYGSDLGDSPRVRVEF